MKYNIYLLTHPLRNKDFYRHCGLLGEGRIPIGLIDRDGVDPGALVTDSEGAYWQINFKGEWVRPLDYELVLEASSRAIRIDKIKPSNKTDKIKSFKSLKNQSVITLDESSYKTLFDLGDGNLSRGIREAAVSAESMVTGEWENLGEFWSLKRFTVSIDDATRALLRRIGFGNMSAGARRAAKLVGMAAQPTDKK